MFLICERVVKIQALILTFFVHFLLIFFFTSDNARTIFLLLNGIYRAYSQSRKGCHIQLYK